MFEVDFHILNQKATPAIYADTLSLRPAAGFTGRVFINTVSPYGVYRDTGTDWVLIASNSSGTGSTGVNGLNGTTNIGLGGNLTIDTSITGNGINFLQFNDLYLFQTVSNQLNLQTQGNNIFSQIYTNGSYLYLGIFDSITNENALIYFNQFEISTSFNGGTNVGLFLSNKIGKFIIGDYSNQRKYNSFVVNDDTNEFYITTSYNQANTDQDLFFATNDSAGVRFVKLGDFNNYSNGVSLIIDDANTQINTKQGGLFKGIALDFDNEKYRLGDNLTNINTDTPNNVIELVANGLKLTGVATSSTGSTLIPQEFINIVVNGNNRKIQLFA